MHKFFLILLVLVCGIDGVHAKDVFVVISGGGSPLSNHYSQYLQARAYTAFLRARYAEDAIWVFFGAGNTTGQAPILADVEKTERDEHGRETTTWIPGVLDGNRPARRDVIERAFREEILPAVKDGGTLYLFVGDHGAPSGGVDPESIMSLWSWDRDPTLPFGWREYASSENLGVAELRRWLSAGIGHGRVVFVMSQCFSGGFHYLGSPRAVALDPSWFTRLPAWGETRDGFQGLPSAAGFTATNDHSVASGCTSDVSADHWAGYERYFPENLLGLDLFTLKTGALPAHASFYDAHVLAVQADWTIDKPRSTSELYLALWAQTIARIEHEPGLAEGVKKQLAPFHDTLNGKEAHVANAAFQQRQQEYRAYIARMIERNPALADLAAADENRLKAVENPHGAGMGNFARQEESGSGDDDSETEKMEDAQLPQRLWERDIVPAWQKAVEAGEVKELPAALVAFELALLKQETHSRRGAWPYIAQEFGADPIRLIYFYGGYANPSTFDPAKAKAVVEWAGRRRQAIREWARKSSDPRVHAAAATYTFWTRDGDAQDAADANNAAPAARAQQGASALRLIHDFFGGLPGFAGLHTGFGGAGPNMSREVAAERIHFYRAVLAAWQFLLDVDERPALTHAAALVELERTPLPPASKQTKVPASASSDEHAPR